MNGQQKTIDSLKNVYQHINDNKHRLLILDTLNYLIRNTGDSSKEEIKYYTEMLKLSQEQNNHILEAKSAKYLSSHYLNKEDFENSVKYAELSKQVSEKHQIYTELLKAYRQLGLVYNHFDKFNIAIKNYQKALQIFNNKLSKEEQNIEKRLLGIIYSSLSTTYRNMHHDSLSIVFDIKSIEWAEKTNDYMRKSLFYTKVGWTYVMLEQYGLAVNNFKKALKDSSRIYVEVYNISAHQGLGYAFYKWKKYDKALHHSRIALKFFRKKENRLYTQATLNTIANIYLETNKLIKAYENNAEAYEIAKEINNKRAIANVLVTFVQLDIANGLSAKAKKGLKTIIETGIVNSLSKSGRILLYGLVLDIAKKENDFKTFAIYSQKQKQVADTLMKYKLSNISRLDLKYQIEKNRKKLAQQQQIIVQKELDKQKFKTSALILLIIITIILLILIKLYKNYIKTKTEVNRMIAEIKKVREGLLNTKSKLPISGQKSLNVENEQDISDIEIFYEEFHQYLIKKYKIDRPELMHLWSEISVGVTRKQYAKNMNLSEETVKSRAKKLYQLLKNASSEKISRFSDAKAVHEYYKNLIWYKSSLKDN
jgi:tetratricopeptide (TPR) repeat protein